MYIWEVSRYVNDIQNIPIDYSKVRDLCLKSTIILNLKFEPLKAKLSICGPSVSNDQMLLRK